MATPAQIIANRENAQHSTGPKTEQGKANCAANAVRHGLTARGFIVPAGQEDAFAQFEDGLRINLIPNGPLEEMLFKRILECGWNLERCRRAGAELFEKISSITLAADPLLDDEHEPKFARLEKYARQYENSMYKAIRELRTLQTETQYRNEIHPLAQEEVDNPELFDQTPQSLSAVCDYQRIIAAIRQHRPVAPSFQNRANAERAAFAFLDKLTAPPTISNGDPVKRTFQAA